MPIIGWNSMQKSQSPAHAKSAGRLDLPMSIADQIANPSGIDKELAQLKALIREHGRTAQFVKVRANRNFFLAMLHLNHPNNRPVNTKRVRWWRAAARDGRWEETNQAFAFDWDGFMRDGQHRSAAFAGEDVERDIWIMFGMKPSGFAAIDVGMPRSSSQTLGLNGVKHAGTVSAIVRFKYRLDHGGLLPDPHLVEQLGEQMADDLLEQSVICAAKLYKTFKTPQSSSALAYWMIARGSRRKAELDQFWDQVSPQDTYGLEAGSSIALLRRKLRSEQGQAKARGQYLYQTQQAAWIILAWNAWVNGHRPAFTWSTESALPVIDAAKG